MQSFRPQVLSPDEIRAMLTNVSPEERAQADKHSLTPLRTQILFEGIPCSAVVRDTEGREYIDCTAQAWSLNVGYIHPDIMAAAQEQMRHLTHVRYSYPTIPRIKLINRLAGMFPGDLTKVALNNQGGGTAIEAALKLAMINKPGAAAFLVAFRAYHGATLATMAATHYMPGTVRFPSFGLDHYIRYPYPHCYRCPCGKSPGNCALACLDAVESVMRYGANAPIAGLLIEPMQGAGGQVPAPQGYLAGLKELCGRHGILLIFDESQTAFGRIGAMSASEHYGVAPDMMVLSKGLGGGFPIGALLARGDLKGFNGAEEHSTFGSNPVAFAAALASIEVIQRLNLAAKARALGERATARLRHMQEENELIGDVRGPGLFIGVDLVENRHTKEPATFRASALVDEAMSQGVLFDTDLPDTVGGVRSAQNVIKIKPPLVITEEQLDRALDVFERALRRVAALPTDKARGP